VTRDVTRTPAIAPVALAIAAAIAAPASGCGVPPGTGAAPPAVAREQAPAWKVRPAGGMIAIDPGLPAAADSLLDARGCATCHAAIVDEWARSRHAVAWTNSIFQTEYSARPQAWCVNCHAPLATQQADLAGPRAAQGVDCAACHVRAGALVARTRRPGSPHETIAEPSFGSPAFCADCHQFTFPVLEPRTGAALRMTPHPMQDTVASFRQSPYARAKDGCLTCHGSRHGHAFAGAHDRGMLEGALDVAWCRDDGALRVTVRNTGAGHSVPAGDIHRHMYLRVWRSSAPEALFQAYFGRRFELAEGGGKRTSWDSTIAPGAARTFRIAPGELRGEAAEPVNLELVYVYIVNEFPRLHRQPAEPTTASAVRRTAAVEALPACGRAPT
jgi:hypothetical protein